ncbi:PREDICTED: uncharacterized protein K02A2.6-like [Vollenhovia emeryi]|uniref:uncharacterized protein K02A2.6-like n=1 Tax=Vollenhovia emeryi TaxID=411798 RepID=UPI0005F3CEBE|nr:PREDICTED: uncharacterized protein K02A2.6-like [Vollenhovia emeryi]
MRLSSLKLEKSMVLNPETAKQSDVLAIHRKQHAKNNKPRANAEPTPVARSGEAAKARFPCWSCGEIHFASKCPFLAEQCPTCKRTGHKDGYCESAGRKPRFGRRSSKIVNAMSIVTRKFVESEIGNTKLKLQLDSGSDWTIISASNWKVLGSPKLRDCEEQALSASNDPIKILGKFNAPLKLHGRENSGPCYVAASDLNVLGSDWMTVLNLWNVPIASICNSINSTSATDLEREVKSRFPSLFADSLDCCNKMKASLTLKPGSQAIFRNRRPVPFAAAEQIANELKRLQLMGVIIPVEYSKYAAPLGAVKKKGRQNTNLRRLFHWAQRRSRAEPISTSNTGGNFRETVPIPCLQQNLFFGRVFAGGTRRRCEKLLTINTHCGLFQVNRLQPGVKTALGVFQQLMDTMMSGAEGAFPFIDDFIKQLEFLGNIVDADGLRPNPERIQTLKRIPPPEDIQQLQAFLGAVTWYGKFIPHLNDLRGPLIELLRSDVKFEWQSAHQEAFEKIKNVLASDLALTHYDPSMKIIVAADAS